MSLSVDVLPKEVLQYIFSYLCTRDKLNVSLVCKKWLSVINCKILLRNINVLINDNNKVPILAQMSRNFLNFSFKLIIVDKKYYELFRRFSSLVECITFEKCEIWKREPVAFDDLTYENLKVLKIIDCDLWTLFPSLPNLSELYLSGNSTITDDGLAILQKSMKNLKAFSLYCHVTFDPKAYRRFYAHGLSYEEYPSPYILSLPAVKSFISERVNTMKELNLNLNITSQALKEISSIENLHLNKISLKNCHECTSSLIELFKNQPSLRVLNLNGTMGMNDDIFNALCIFIPDIEEVYIRSCSLTDDSFCKIFQLKNLKKLDIGLNYASESGFCQAVSNFSSLHLVYLNVTSILIKNIDLLIRKCKYLVYLNLTCCEVSDKLLHFISENLIYLEYLSLKRTEVTDYGLTGKIELEKDEKLAENVREKFVHKPISNLKYLKKLKLNSCEKITECGIVESIQFQYLEYLNVTGCFISCSTVQALLMQNPNIKKIYCDCSYEDPKIKRKKSKYGFLMDSEFSIYDTVNRF